MPNRGQTVLLRAYHTPKNQDGWQQENKGNKNWHLTYRYGLVKND